MWKQEIRLAGSGGQGLGLAAMVLAEAALANRLYVTTLQSYGPEARGGASRSDVTISDQDIANPWFSDPSLLLALSQQAWAKFGSRLANGGQAIVDLDLVGESDRPAVFALPLVRIAQTELREKLAANMIALGALGVLLGRIPLDILQASAAQKAPKGFSRINQEAVARGWQLMAEAKGGVTRGRGVGGA
ncbi:MAG: 2-oxoacid:acceptor oxidoreductase family protein [Thermaerobacter sp.]|nr:2-oxoacid:acceptor oxidoreductase family protein [Thermaerobacter sp.]